MKEFLQIIKYKLTWLNVFLIVITVILSLYYYKIAAITFVLLSNLYDILGYHFTLVRRTTQLPEKIIIRAYRINQLLFDFLLLVLIGMSFDWIAALAGWMMKNFGLQDLFYYIFLQMKLPEKWTWMKWTPLGFFKGDLSKNEIILQTIIGVVISLVILLLR
mgnify:CR=1 FL=1|jgi:hypothetical protein